MKDELNETLKAKRNGVGDNFERKKHEKEMSTNKRKQLDTR
jgi:hypothetical protein